MTRSTKPMHINTKPIHINPNVVVGDQSNLIIDRTFDNITIKEYTDLVDFDVVRDTIETDHFTDEWNLDY